jgi:hypothetical protein
MFTVIVDNVSPFAQVALSVPSTEIIVLKFSHLLPCAFKLIAIIFVEYVTHAIAASTSICIFCTASFLVI